MRKLRDILKDMSEPDKKQAKAWCNWRLKQELCLEGDEPESEESNGIQ